MVDKGESVFGDGKETFDIYGGHVGLDPVKCSIRVSARESNSTLLS